MSQKNLGRAFLFLALLVFVRVERGMASTTCSEAEIKDVEAKIRAQVVAASANKQLPAMLMRGKDLAKLTDAQRVERYADEVAKVQSQALAQTFASKDKDSGAQAAQTFLARPARRRNVDIFARCSAKDAEAMPIEKACPSEATELDIGSRRVYVSHLTPQKVAIEYLKYKIRLRSFGEISACESDQLPCKFTDRDAFIQGKLNVNIGKNYFVQTKMDRSADESNRSTSATIALNSQAIQACGGTIYLVSGTLANSQDVMDRLSLSTLIFQKGSESIVLESLAMQSQSKGSVLKFQIPDREWAQYDVSSLEEYFSAVIADKTPKKLLTPEPAATGLNPLSGDGAAKAKL